MYIYFHVYCYHYFFIFHFFFEFFGRTFTWIYLKKKEKIKKKNKMFLITWFSNQYTRMFSIIPEFFLVGFHTEWIYFWILWNVRHGSRTFHFGAQNGGAPIMALSCVFPNDIFIWQHVSTQNENKQINRNKEMKRICGVVG